MAYLKISLPVAMLISASLVMAADPQVTRNEQLLEISKAKAPPTPIMLKIYDLVRRGANINVQDQEGNTSLMNLVQNGQPFQTVQILLDHGADVNIQNKEEETPLFAAVRRTDEDAEYIVKLLIDAGAQGGIYNKKGKKAVEYAPEERKKFIFESLSKREQEKYTMPFQPYKKQKR